MREPVAPPVTIRLPVELLAAVDALASGREFVSRSDVIRTFLREKLAERGQKVAA
jgi:Arc/MetJ-type ribon-helix-helix transcriptional regulator